MLRSSYTIVIGGIIGATLLGFTMHASIAQTPKPEAKPAAAKKGQDAATRVPAPTPMPPGKPGGALNVMLREDLSQGFAIHEIRDHLDRLSVLAVLQQPGHVRPRESCRKPGQRGARARRAMVLAGQLPEPRLLPPEERQVA